MTKFARLTSLFISALITGNLNAAVLIQTQNAHREITSIYIEGNKARIEMPRHKGYVVMDVAQKIMNVVIHEQHAIYDMSEYLQNNQAHAAPARYVDTYTKTMGLGPNIAGYETEEYALYANDSYCGSLYVSVNAIRDMGIDKFVDVFANMERNLKAKMAAITGMNMDMTLQPCEEAERKAILRVRNMGFPLKSIDQNKRLDSVVIKINKNARLPQNAFGIPANYKMTNPTQMMNSQMKQMQKMQPQMQEMMKNMTPEMRHMLQQQMQQHPR